MRARQHPPSPWERLFAAFAAISASVQPGNPAHAVLGRCRLRASRRCCIGTAQRLRRRRWLDQAQARIPCRALPTPSHIFIPGGLALIFIYQQLVIRPFDDAPVLGWSR